jgi:hypothetical protein
MQDINSNSNAQPDIQIFSNSLQQLSLDLISAADNCLQQCSNNPHEPKANCLLTPVFNYNGKPSLSKQLAAQNFTVEVFKTLTES